MYKRQDYKATPALAIVHCHPRAAIAYSLSRDEIVPIDNEASYLLKKVPVIYEEFASGTPEMAKNVAQTLSKYKIVMLRGHGSLAAAGGREDMCRDAPALRRPQRREAHTRRRRQGCGGGACCHL